MGFFSNCDEQNSKIEILKTENAQLQARIDTLEQELCQSPLVIIKYCA